MTEPTEFWETNLVYLILSGSRSYGLDRTGSDVDTRGICIPPRRFLFGLDRFEQHESADHNHVVFGLEKFVRLALDANPNIIEMLYVEPRHILMCDRFGEQLLAHRELFLSRKVGERFAGYAIDQLGRMERHHRWLVDPPAGQPDPAAYGGVAKEGRIRWPHFDAQRRYQADLKHWNSYLEWVRNRNPARAALEAQFGYDTKHAMHLFRLLRMGEEILREGKVQVFRPDAEWLLSVRDGALSYEEVLAMAAHHQVRLKDLVESSPLPDRPDVEAADALLIRLQESYHFGKAG